MEDRVLSTWKLFDKKRIAEKSINCMTLEEKGLLVQLEIMDPFHGLAPPRPDSSMSPEDKGALLLWHIIEGHRLFESRINEQARPGDRFIVDVPLDFSGANLDLLGLMGKDLGKADFRKASARGANLVGVNLTGANLEGADLEDAYLSNANLRDCNLKGHRGFPSCGGAILDIDTYQKSDWRPEDLSAWHRAGAKILGLDEFPPEAIQAILHSFQPTGPSAFLSYGGCDSDVAMQIATHLESRGVRVWFAAWDLDYGDDVVGRIEQALESTSAFVILLSPEALQRPWVRQELSAAFKKALDESGRRVIPIVHKPCKLPAFLGTRKWLELKVPYIEKLDELARTLRGQAVRRTTPTAEKFRSREEAVQHFVAGWERMLGKHLELMGGKEIAERKARARRQIEANNRTDSESKKHREAVPAVAPAMSATNSRAAGRMKVRGKHRKNPR